MNASHPPACVWQESLISFSVALTIDPARRGDLERTLFEVSDPKSAEYGKHRTPSHIKDILKVPEEQVLPSYLLSCLLTPSTSSPPASHVSSLGGSSLPHLPQHDPPATSSLGGSRPQLFQGGGCHRR